MTATQTWDVFSTVDGHGSYVEGGYWGRQGPELLEHRAALRMRNTVFPVVSGRTGTSPILRGAGDLDLELLDSRSFDGRSVEPTYRPSPRRSS